jgi:hypothetical protein
VRFTGQNGKLVIVADVARLLPRLWDGQRALRFLAGLAVLALAFAANAGLIGSPADPAASPDSSADAVPAEATPAVVGVVSAVLLGLLALRWLAVPVSRVGAGRVAVAVPAGRGPPPG